MVKNKREIWHEGQLPGTANYSTKRPRGFDGGVYDPMADDVVPPEQVISRPLPRPKE